MEKPDRHGETAGGAGRGMVRIVLSVLDGGVTVAEATRRRKCPSSRSEGASGGSSWRPDEVGQPGVERGDLRRIGPFCGP
jgi:hypothetical protein